MTLTALMFKVPITRGERNQLRCDSKCDATTGWTAVRTSTGERRTVETSGVNDHTVIRAGSGRAVECPDQAEAKAASALRRELKDRPTTIAIVAGQVATAAGCAVEISRAVECQPAVGLTSFRTIESVEGVRYVELPSP